MRGTKMLRSTPVAQCTSGGSSGTLMPAALTNWSCTSTSRARCSGYESWWTWTVHKVGPRYT
jgi:hypothetical protein